jgi:hypothetical protein
MNAKKILLAAAALLVAVAIGLGWRASHVARVGDAARQAEAAQRARLRAEIARARERLGAAESERAKLVAALDALRAAADAKTPVRPPVKALDDKQKAALAAIAQMPWWDVVLERNPHLQALGRASRRTELASTYGAFWRKAGLSSEAIERFKDFALEAEERARDLRAVARERRLADTDPAMAALREQSEAQLAAAQRGLLGDAGWQELQNYERTSPVRSMLALVAGPLAFTDSPLRPEQADELTAVIAPLCRTYQAGGDRAYPGAVEIDAAMRERRPARETLDLDAVREATRGLLSPVQLMQFEAVFAQPTASARVFNLLLKSSEGHVAGFWLGRNPL